MSTRIQFRRGTTAENNAFTGAAGEATFDTERERLRVHNGSKAGGYEIEHKRTLNPSLSDFDVLYIAHRGSSILYPEESMLAYLNTIADGINILECDVQTLSDGGLGMMHDNTVDRTTTGTGNVSSFNSTSFKALAIDGDAQLLTNYGNVSPILFQDWIDKFNGRAIFVPEDKDAVSMAALVSALRRSGVRRDQALIQCFTLGNLSTPIAYGYPALYLTGGATSDISTAQSMGVQYVGIDRAASDANISAWVASGIKATCWTVNRRYVRDAKLALGVVGFFSDDPAYLKATRPLYTTDQFSLGTWIPGMLGSGSDDGSSQPSRGKFTSGGYWGYDSSVAAGYVSCLQGYLSPIKGQASPNSYSFTFNLIYDATLSDDTRWGGVFIGNDDRPYTDNGAADLSSGYHFLMRKNGQMQIYRKPGGGNPILLNAATGSTIAAGSEITYRITVTATDLTLSRLNSSGGVDTSLTVTDSTYRGGYIHLGRNGLACRFRKLSVS